MRPPVITTTTVTGPITPTTTTSRPSTHFLPTIPPPRMQLGGKFKDFVKNPYFILLITTPIGDDTKSSSTPTLPVTSTTTTFQLYSKNKNGHMISPPSTNRDTTKPLLHSILQTETAAPFTKKPSSVYQIEFTSHIYNPEAINSMATSSSSSAYTPTTTTTTFMPTKPSIRPVSIKATTKASSHSSLSHVAAAAAAENEKYYVPEVQMGWPVYNLIIEGHSKVKTYGSKNDDPLGNSMPKIRPIQAKENPIVEHVTDDVDSRPEYARQKIKKEASKQTAMTSLLSLLDGSFGNFLGGEDVSGGGEEEEGGGSKRKTRSVQVDSDIDDKQERDVGVSFQVDDVRPQIYRKGTVVSESLWPFQNADTTR